jgi:hypothetical protein
MIRQHPHAQSADLPWSRTAPTVDDVRTWPTMESFWWVRGGNFNRAVMVECNCGVTSAVDPSAPAGRKFWAENNFTFPGPFPSHIWRPEISNWAGLRSLEWAGPIPMPRSEARGDAILKLVNAALGRRT